jgi:hypothetical protein
MELVEMELLDVEVSLEEVSENGLMVSSKLLEEGTRTTLGCVRGIKLARQVNFSKVEVRVDSIGVVNDITNKKSSKLGGISLIRRIWQMLELDWEVVFKHSYREANQLADVLAKHSYSIEGECCFFQDCPSCFKHILVADEKGFVTPRSILL